MRNLLSDYGLESKIVLVTHSGLCHSDDVACTALFQLYFEMTKQKTELVRTRDKLAAFGENAIIYDVFLGRLDHHQGDVISDGRILSSIGKVWRWGRLEFMKIFCIDFESWKSIDENFIKPIDISDTSGVLNPISYAIIALRGTMRDEQSAFEVCLNYMKETFRAILNEERVQTGFRSLLRKSSSIEINGKVILIVERSIPSLNLDTFYPSADGIIMPLKNGHYQLRMLNKINLDKEKCSLYPEEVFEVLRNGAEISSISILEKIL